MTAGVGGNAMPRVTPFILVHPVHPVSWLRPFLHGRTGRERTMPGEVIPAGHRPTRPRNQRAATNFRSVSTACTVSGFCPASAVSACTICASRSYRSLPKRSCPSCV